jgi:hypothetical protein
MLLYNYEIYNDRSDQVSWNNRQFSDPKDGALLSIKPVFSPAFMANNGFLAAQNRLFVGHAESVKCVRPNETWGGHVTDSLIGQCFVYPPLFSGLHATPGLFPIDLR